jgi:hypothetical protein
VSRTCKECFDKIPKASESTTAYHKKKFCGFDCMASWGLRKAQDNHLKEKVKRKEAEFKEMKKRVDSQGIKAKAMKAAQSAFNAFIRERDKDLPCVSCGKYTAASGGYRGAGGFDAGHYRSRGANPELRFNEDNVFKQCVACNRDKSGNVVNMRIEILKRIGQERLDAIEGEHEIVKYTLDDLKEIAAKYRKKTKELKGDS